MRKHFLRLMKHVFIGNVNVRNILINFSLFSLALSTRIIDRIFSRTRSKVKNPMLQDGKMSYTDFVIFLLAEEDKRHPRAIEYWFR